MTPKSPLVPALQAPFLSQLRERRRALAVSQQELAEVTGISRVSVTRAEQPGADVQLSTFLALAQHLGLEVKLQPIAGTLGHKPLVHRGLAYSRVASASAARLNPLEAELAAEWERVNEPNPNIPPLFPALVPQGGQPEAEVAATIVQWLGSQVGLEFLRKALGQAGYTVVATADNAKGTAKSK